MTDGSEPSTPSAGNPARALAVRVLGQVLGAGAYAAPLLDEALAKARLPGRDAGLATHLVYGTLRHQYTLDLALSKLIRPDTTPKLRALLLAGAFEKLILGTPAHAVVNEYVNLARKDFGKLSGLTNAVLRRIELPEGTPETTSAMPDWLIQTFQTAYGDHTGAVLLDQLQPAPLWLWLAKGGVKALEAEGHTVEPGHGDVYKVALSAPLRSTKAYQNGLAQPINPASLAAVLALGPVSGQPVLDLAGGAGVKAAMLAARGADVISVDLAAAKHKAARSNLNRLHLNAKLVVADLTGPNTLKPAPLVLLDAPCTGSGTLRAHPEIKLRLTPAKVTEMAALQQRLLRTAARLTRPGGTLVYSVCSVTEQEGPEVVQAFLKEHTEFSPEALPELNVPTVAAGPGLRTLDAQGLDGFFIARLKRREKGGL